MRFYPMALFLLLAFGLADGSALALYFSGLLDFTAPGFITTGFLAVLAVVPAVAAWCTRQIVEDTQADYAVWPLPLGAASVGAALFPVLFGLIYAVLAFAGWETVDWGFNVLLAQLANEGQPPLELPGAGPIFFVAGIVFSMALGATLYFGLAAGQEYGWRGFLLPRLRPLGALPAYLLTTLIWLAWLAPLVLVWAVSVQASSSLWLELGEMALMFALLSITLCAIADRYRHFGLSAFWLGAFLAQYQGVWDFLFPGSQPPWSGAHGIPGLVVWALLALGTLLFVFVTPRRQNV